MQLYGKIRISWNFDAALFYSGSLMQHYRAEFLMLVLIRISCMKFHWASYWWYFTASSPLSLFPLLGEALVLYGVVFLAIQRGSSRVLHSNVIMLFWFQLWMIPYLLNPIGRSLPFLVIFIPSSSSFFHFIRVAKRVVDWVSSAARSICLLNFGSVAPSPPSFVHFRIVDFPSVVVG